MFGGGLGSCVGFELGLELVGEGFDDYVAVYWAVLHLVGLEAFGAAFSGNCDGFFKLLFAGTVLTTLAERLPRLLLQVRLRTEVGILLTDHPILIIPPQQRYSLIK